MFEEVAPDDDELERMDEGRSEHRELSWPGEAGWQHPFHAMGAHRPVNPGSPHGLLAWDLLACQLFLACLPALSMAGLLTPCFQSGSYRES